MLYNFFLYCPLLAICRQKGIKIKYIPNTGNMTKAPPGQTLNRTKKISQLLSRA